MRVCVDMYTCAVSEEGEELKKKKKKKKKKKPEEARRRRRRSRKKPEEEAGRTKLQQEKNWEGKKGPETPELLTIPKNVILTVVTMLKTCRQLRFCKSLSVQLSSLRCPQRILGVKHPQQGAHCVFEVWAVTRPVTSQRLSCERGEGGYFTTYFLVWSAFDRRLPVALFGRGNRLLYCESQEKSWGNCVSYALMAYPSLWCQGIELRAFPRGFASLVEQ